MKNEELKLNRFLEKAHNKYDNFYDYTEFDYKTLIDLIKLKIKTLYTISYA